MDKWKKLLIITQGKLESWKELRGIRAINDEIEHKGSAYRQAYLYSFQKWRDRNFNFNFESISKHFISKLNLPVVYKADGELVTDPTNSKDDIGMFSQIISLT